MAKTSSFEWVVWLIVLIGALNWGLVGFLKYDLVANIFGGFATIVYDIVGIAALVGFYFMYKYSQKK